MWQLPFLVHFISIFCSHFIWAVIISCKIFCWGAFLGAFSSLSAVCNFKFPDFDFWIFVTFNSCNLFEIWMKKNQTFTFSSCNISYKYDSFLQHFSWNIIVSNLEDTIHRQFFAIFIKMLAILVITKQSKRSPQRQSLYKLNFISDGKLIFSHY